MLDKNKWNCYNHIKFSLEIDMYLINLIKNFISDKWSFVFELGLLAFITSNKQFYSHQNYQIRILLCVFFLFYIILVSWFSGIKKNKIGLISENWAVSIKETLLPTTIFLGLLTLLRFIFPALFNLGIHYNSINQVIYRVLAYVVISIPVQEIIFRGYMVTRLEQFSKNKYFLISISALLFSLIHWPLNSLLITLGSFIFGVFLANSFVRYRNLYTLMIIHSILGIVLLLYTVKLG